MSTFDELLEELHPCCLKEIESKKQHARITKELRVGDRSNARLDILKKTLNRSPAMTCHCCDNFGDYPLLEQLRIREEAANLPNVDVGLGHRGKEEVEEERQEEEDDFSDIDFEDNSIMNFLKQQMTDQLVKQERMREEANFFGFTGLSDDR